MDHAHEARALLDSAARDLDNVVDDSPVSALYAQAGALLGIGHALLALREDIADIRSILDKRS